MGYISYGSFSLGSWGTVKADIVLTRGWNEGEQTAAVTTMAAAKYAPANYTSLYNVKFAKKPMPRTVVKALPTYEKVEMKVVSADEFKANVEKLRKSLKTAARK